MRSLAGSLRILVALFSAATVAAHADAESGAFGPSASAPADYLAEKTRRYPIVLIGEAHWIRHDALFVAEVVPRLAKQRTALAVEWLRASDQPTLDRLIAAPAWDGSVAMSLMRSAAWPYAEYAAILRAAWEANHASAGAMRVIGLAPDPDWRETLLRAKGISYDAFMADLVAAEFSQGRHVLVYCGIHHAFTRYQQPELDLAGHATSYFDRAGNILRRRFGERVFVVTLHRPVWCGKEPWSYCLPLGGAIDCAGVKRGSAVGFDVAASVFGPQVIDPAVYYAHGYESLRLSDMTDGYIWTKPIEEFELVRLIPLSEFAPDEAAVREVATDNPLSEEKDLDRERLEALWAEDGRARADAMAYRHWLPLKGWRQSCDASGPPAHGGARKKRPS